MHAKCLAHNKIYIAINIRPYTHCSSININLQPKNDKFTEMKNKNYACLTSFLRVGSNFCFINISLDLTFQEEELF